MFQLRVLFSILFLFSLACMIKGLRFKRKNPGYVVVAGVISVCDLLCIAIVGAQNAKEAAVVLLPYYILHSWLLFAFLIMVVQTDRFRRFTPVLIVSAALCAYQTYLVVRQYMGERIRS